MLDLEKREVSIFSSVNLLIKLAVQFLNLETFGYADFPHFWLLSSDTPASPRGVWRFKSLTVFFTSCSLLRCDLEILPTAQDS